MRNITIYHVGAPEEHSPILGSVFRRVPKRRYKGPASPASRPGGKRRCPWLARPLLRDEGFRHLAYRARHPPRPPVTLSSPWGTERHPREREVLSSERKKRCLHSSSGRRCLEPRFPRGGDVVRELTGPGTPWPRATSSGHWPWARNRTGTRRVGPRSGAPSLASPIAAGTGGGTPPPGTQSRSSLTCSRVTSRL